MVGKQQADMEFLHSKKQIIHCNVVRSETKACKANYGNVWEIWEEVVWKLREKNEYIQQDENTRVCTCRKLHLSLYR